MLTANQAVKYLIFYSGKSLVWGLLDIDVILGTTSHHITLMGKDVFYIQLVFRSSQLSGATADMT